MDLCVKPNSTSGFRGATFGLNFFDTSAARREEPLYLAFLVLDLYLLSGSASLQVRDIGFEMFTHCMIGFMQRLRSIASQDLDLCLTN